MSRFAFGAMPHYIARYQLWGIFVALLAIGSFDLLVYFIGEAGKIDEEYTVTNALWRSVLSMPSRLNELAPAVALIGTLMSVGTLTNNFEMAALRALGYSKQALLKPILLVGVLVAALVAINAEWLAPHTSRIAETKSEIENDARIGERVWLRDARRFVTAIRADDRRYRDVAIFELSDDARLVALTRAEAMTIEGEGVKLFRARASRFADDSIEVTRAATAQLAFSPRAFESRLELEPKAMALRELLDHAQFLRAGYLNSKAYELEFWTRFSHPLSVIVLLFLAAPFVVTPMMRASMGQRLFIGVMLGLTCFIVNRAISSLALIYQAPAWFAVFLPLALFSIFGWWRFRRCR